MALPKIETQKDLQKIIDENKVVIIEVYATWCLPCRSIAATFYELAHASKNVTSVKCNCDDAPEVVKFLRVSSIPAFIKFEDGKQTGFLYGPEKELLRKMFADKPSL